MPNEDESLGTEQLPQTELEATPGAGEQPTSEAKQNLQNDRSQTESTETHRDSNQSQAK
jgi:hypothetical protein